MRAVRLGNGVAVGESVSSNGTDAPPPLFKSSALNTIGTVANGDFVLLFRVYPGGAAGTTPTGWTRIVDVVDVNSNRINVYYSTYSGSNAVANSTNFPFGNGYFLTMVYGGGCTLHQQGTLTDSANAAASVTAAAMTNPTTPGSVMVGFFTSRGPNTTSMTASGDMVQKMYANNMSFFDAALFESIGVQSGSRVFTRTGSLEFNVSAILLEVKSSGTPLDEGEYTIDCGSYADEVIVYQYDPADLTIKPQIHFSEPV